MARRSLWAVILWVACASLPAHAAFHLFRIDQVYSNSDGEVQYVVMREASGANGESFWAGNTLATTTAAGVGKQFTFPANLPSSLTANRSVLIATPGFAALGLVTPDYVVPARFIPTDGGSLDYAGGTDRIALPPLPTDGATAITRTGATTAATARNFANVAGTMTSVPVGSVEFYNASLDHYFISALAPDIDALDSGRIAGWARTGQSFGVYPSQAAGGAGVSPVCRILIPPPANSHFFSASPQECTDTLAKFPLMVEETAAAFFIALPVTTGPTAGTCPGGTTPVYRVFNNRADGNHRYMTDRAIRDSMVASGGTAEGYGDDAVIMCAPPFARAAGAADSPAPPDMTQPPPYSPPYPPM